MNWDAVGALGEIVGAVAVVGSLWYLAIQIRESRRSSEAQGTLASTEVASRWRGNLMMNNELALAVAKANESEELSHRERIQVRTLADDLFIAGAAAYLSTSQTGALHDDTGEVEYVVKILSENPGLVSEWERAKPFTDLMSPIFCKAVEAKLAANKHESG